MKKKKVIIISVISLIGIGILVSQLIKSDKFESKKSVVADVNLKSQNESETLDMEIYEDMKLLSTDDRKISKIEKATTIEETTQKSTLEQEIQKIEETTYLDYKTVPKVVKVEEVDLDGKPFPTTIEVITEETTEVTTQYTTSSVNKETTKKQETTTQTTTKKPQVTTTEKQTETTTKAPTSSGTTNKQPQQGDVNEKGEVYNATFDVWMKPTGSVHEDFGTGTQEDWDNSPIIGH